MDHFEKFVRKLSPKLRSRVLVTTKAILQGRLQGLDVKPLRGEKNWYRCRIGDIRILFYQAENGRYVVYDAGFRGKVYRKMN